MLRNRKLKICASIMIALAMVGMPLYILTMTTFGSRGGDQMNPLINKPIEVPPNPPNPIPTNDPPFVGVQRSHHLTMTTDSTFDLQFPIQLNDIFRDVDSVLNYSWICDSGLVSVGITGSEITSFKSKGTAGEGTISVLASDREYVAAYYIPVSVVPRTALYLNEDTTLTLALGPYVDNAVQNYGLRCGDRMRVESGFAGNGTLTATLTPDPNWYGTNTLGLSVYPVVNSIRPPRPPRPGTIISSAPPGPEIPPPPAAIEYAYYDFGVNVLAVNDPPYIINYPVLTMYEDKAVYGAFNVADCFADVDSPLVYSLSLKTDHRIGAELTYGGYVNLWSEPNWFGTEVLTVSATDGEYTVYLDIPVHVLPVNDIPYATGKGDLITINEDSEVTVCLADYISDVDNVLRYSFLSDDANSTISLNETTWNMSVVPNKNWNGDIHIVVFGYDNETGIARNLTVSVKPVNDMPLITADSGLVFAEGTSFVLNMSDYISDVDSELEFYVASLSGNLMVNQTWGSVAVISARSEYWNGQDRLRIQAYDGEFLVSVVINVTVVPVNNAPVFADAEPGLSMNEDSVLAIPVARQFTDIDGDTLSYEFYGGDHIQLVFDAGTGMLTVIPAAEWSGESWLEMRAYDGSLWAAGTVPVIVTAVNDPPVLVATIPPVLMESGNTTYIDVYRYFKDVDSPALAIEIVGAHNVSIVPMEVMGFYQIRTPKGWQGAEVLTVRASDGEYTVETQMTVSATMHAAEQVAAADMGLFQAVFWMGLGVVLIVSLATAYGVAKNHRSRPRAAPGKGRVV